MSKTRSPGAKVPGSRPRAGNAIDRTMASSGLFREIPPTPQTAHDKTAAAARLIRDTEAQRRAERTAALRAARLARDLEAADAPQGPAETSD